MQGPDATTTSNIAETIIYSLYSLENLLFRFFRIGAPFMGQFTYFWQNFGVFQFRSHRNEFHSMTHKHQILDIRHETTPQTTKIKFFPDVWVEAAHWIIVHLILKLDPSWAPRKIPACQSSCSPTIWGRTVVLPQVLTGHRLVVQRDESTVRSD